MIVASNTTPLIGMAAIERFELLQELFGEIYIPQAVYEEATIDTGKDDRLYQKVVESSWLKVMQVQNISGNMPQRHQ